MKDIRKTILNHIKEYFKSKEKRDILQIKINCELIPVLSELSIYILEYGYKNIIPIFTKDY